MSTEPTNKEDEINDLPENPVPPVANEARRRFTKAGLAVSGVLMTLSSRSLLACEAVSPSGFVSANQSRHGSHHESRGRRPYYWSADCSWPISKDVRFRDVFHQCPTHSPYYKATCHDVVCGKVTIDTEVNCGVGQYLVAGYLNACRGWTEEFLNKSDCVNLGNEWLQTGEYRPHTHVIWHSRQIANYFENTQS